MAAVFHGAMPATDGANSERPSRPAAASPDSANSRRRPRSRARREDNSATSLRAIIASSAFLVLFATTMLIGGHAAIDPLLRSVTAARDAKAMGDIVLAMPDRRFCRHMTFDNATDEMTETTVSLCPDNITKDRYHSAQGFAWGEH